MIAVLRDCGSEIEISVTDPTHELDKAKISIKGAYEFLDCNSKKIKTKCLKTKSTIVIDLALANGRPFKVHLRKI